MNEEEVSPGSTGPAYYAQPKFLRRTRGREWWTVLHPPYTLLHLSLATIGACLSPPVSAPRLFATLGAFFLAVGIGAHCLDELTGRPLRTTIPSWQLVSAAVTGLMGAVIFGIVGIFVVSAYLAIFIAVGVTIAVSYNLELFHGRLHNTAVVVGGWGGFPVLTAYFAQHDALSFSAGAAAIYGTLVTLIQQQLSTPARELRRRTDSVDGVVVRSDGSSHPLNKQMLLQPLEQALKTLCWAGPVLAASLLLARFA